MVTYPSRPEATLSTAKALCTCRRDRYYRWSIRLILVQRIRKCCQAGCQSWMFRHSSSVFPAEKIKFRFSPAISRRSNNGWGPAIAPKGGGGAENAGLKSQAVPVPRMANETIRSLTVSSMPLNLTVNTEPFLSQNFPGRAENEMTTVLRRMRSCPTGPAVPAMP